MKIRVIATLGMAFAACAGTVNPYPKMAPINEYLMTQDAEIAMARSAGPSSISKDADVLVLDRQGYHAAVKGHNGFVCAVLRGWTAPVDDANFWNPKLRGPICFNAAAARSYLPRVFKRTALVLAGKTKEQLTSAVNAAFEAKEIPVIEPNSMCYMLSKQGYLSDEGGHWHPHMMIYVPETKADTWGADQPGSPVLSSSDHLDRVTVFMIPVATWSDGSADADHMAMR